MATTIITQDQLKQWFSGKYFHKAYNETVELANRIRTHADGLYPHELIAERRPNESEKIHEYRKKIWKPITRPYFNKVLASLNKIRRSTEWGIQFDESAFPARIAPEERLDAYLTTGFPRFDSFTNWAFDILLKEMSVDANSWIVVIPQGEIKENEYLKPYPEIFKSSQIIDYKEGDFVVVLSTDKSTYTSENKKCYGDRYYIITANEIQTWDQVSADRKFKLKYQIVHDTQIIPAFRLKAPVKSTFDGGFVNESRLSAMMERFDEAAREYSDLQVEVVKHQYSERWEIAEDDCPHCKGKGVTKIAGLRNVEGECRECKGSGVKQRGPFVDMYVKRPMAGEASVPLPPAGYLQKDATIVTTQDARIEKHIWHALSAINMEFLFEKPLQESGIAKAYDTDETNNFVHAFAEDIVANMDRVAFIINEMRYRLVVTDPEQRKAMLPKISVPERFDIFSAQVMEQGLAAAKTNKSNPVIINALEIDYATKKFNSNPEIANHLRLVLTLDPLPNVTEEDKVMKLQNGGISKATYIISSNIHEFISRAMDEKGQQFATMALKDQKALMKQYADELINSISTKSEVLSDVTEG